MLTGQSEAEKGWRTNPFLPPPTPAQTNGLHPHPALNDAYRNKPTCAFKKGSEERGTSPCSIKDCTGPPLSKGRFSLFITIF